MPNASNPMPNIAWMLCLLMIFLQPVGRIGKTVIAVPTAEAEDYL